MSNSIPDKLAQNEKIVFSDINFELQTAGQDEIVYNAKAIVNQIFMVWGTPKRTRPMLRDYGCDMLANLFEPCNAATAMKLRYDLREALVWGARVEVRQSEPSGVT